MDWKPAVVDEYAVLCEAEHLHTVEFAVSHQVGHIEQCLCRARRLSMIEMDLI
jgi:hypothetical protein